MEGTAGWTRQHWLTSKSRSVPHTPVVLSMLCPESGPPRKAAFIYGAHCHKMFRGLVKELETAMEEQEEGTVQGH